MDGWSDVMDGWMITIDDDDYPQTNLPSSIHSTCRSRSLTRAGRGGREVTTASQLASFRA